MMGAFDLPKQEWTCKDCFCTFFEDDAEECPRCYGKRLVKLVPIPVNNKAKAKYDKRFKK
jgi:hypothetical protein